MVRRVPCRRVIGTTRPVAQSRLAARGKTLFPVGQRTGDRGENC